MKKMPLTAKICLLSAGVLTLLGVILRTVAMFVCYDGEVGYFDSTPLSLLLTILSFAAALLPLPLTLLIPKGSLPTTWPIFKRNIVAVVPFALFAVAGGWTLWVGVSGDSATMLLLSGILALASALYYIMTTGKTAPHLVAWIGYLPILWGLISMAETYTDQWTTMNSPIKLALQFGFLGVMLVTVSELRFLLGKPAPRASLCFHSIAIYFCLTGSIPTLVALAAGILDRPIHGAYALGCLGVGIYAAVRLVVYLLFPDISGNTPETEVSSTDAEADAQ
ncbi:MAG: hypothetical protein E7661_08055 [Ruminococcaceae bacterium]|nr:hypothetical protein [Oscillospiraceae bacterium]